MTIEEIRNIIEEAEYDYIGIRAEIIRLVK